MLVLGVDTETTGVDLNHGCYPFFVTISAVEEGENRTLFWEWDVDPLTRIPRWTKEDVQEITDLLRKADKYVLQHAKFDIKALSRVGVCWEDDWFSRTDDTLFMAHLVASGEPHDLTSTSLKYLRVDIKPYEDRLKEAVMSAKDIVSRKYKDWKVAKEHGDGMPSAKGDLWKWDMWVPRAVAKAEDYPADHPWWTALQEYSNPDSQVLPPLAEVFEAIIDARGLRPVYEKRRELIPVIYSMEAIGVTYSKNRLDELMGRLEKESAEAEKVCLEIADGKLEKLPKSGTTKPMRELLFEDWGLPVIKSSDKTGEPSCDKAVLEQWEGSLDHESKEAKFIRNLRVKRSRDTGLSYSRGYVRAGLPSLIPGWEDMVHLYPSLNATGSVTLRFSSSNPNEQNISKQSDTNLRWAFGPGPGREWWSLDYENIELRIPAYQAGEELMIQLFERPDDPPYFGSVHLLMFDTLHPEMFAEHGANVKTVYKSTWYQWTKNGDFAVQYGAMEESGTADAAYHVEGAQRRIQERFTKIKEFNDYQIDFAKREGYVNTMVDKEVGAYPIQCSRNQWGRIRPTTPLNYHTQSTAMWCMCRAMIRCSNFLQQWNRSRGVKESLVQVGRRMLDRRGGYIIMQVHDELVFDLPAKPPATPGGVPGNFPVILELKKLMEQSGDDIGIPLKVEASYHPHNWSKAEKICLDSNQSFPKLGQPRPQPPKPLRKAPPKPLGSQAWMTMKPPVPLNRKS